MALFAAHLDQAKRNLSFLESVNKNIQERYDWQVTICFYVAVHLINAYLADKENSHYRSHSDVEAAINPYGGSCTVSDNVFTSFKKLRNLSRRSRYLIHETPSKDADGLCHLTYDVHLNKAVRYLDTILSFINLIYKTEDIPITKISCSGINFSGLRYFSEP